MELEAGIAAISEPAYIPDNGSRFCTIDKLAVIYWRPALISSVVSLVLRGNNYVIAKFGEFYLCSCYISRNADHAEFLTFLDKLGEAVRQINSKLIVCGDFNFKSTMWEANRTDRRGSLVEDWSAENDLRLLNSGAEPTCIRPQGNSIIDLSWATPSIVEFVHEWQVLSEIFTLFDHAYISFNVGARSVQQQCKVKLKYPRWNWKKVDWEKFQTSLSWSCATWNDNVAEAEEILTSSERLEKWIRDTMSHACDVAAKRSGKPPRKNKAYWWSDTIAGLRAEAIRTFKAWKRSRRRRREASDNIAQFERTYRMAQRNLRYEIGKAKAKAWQELIEVIESDPWGLPYRIVLRRLRGATPSITETLEQEKLNRLLTSLFPIGLTHDPGSIWQEWSSHTEWRDEWSVIPSEKKAAGNVAPGVDGIVSKA
ncbi:uncharacterized protein LOC115240094 [Formica exsecta]|uniref:uncharacterized protein LOC115240094 n=1 Tax=Formica exsecta TaxID=72781 RepID=UPI00114212C9|nr:uncharacterized protein LOC115240094 [Formica exsecta]